MDFLDLSQPMKAAAQDATGRIRGGAKSVLQAPMSPWSSKVLLLVLLCHATVLWLLHPHKGKPSAPKAVVIDIFDVPVPGPASRPPTVKANSEINKPTKVQHAPVSDSLPSQAPIRQAPQMLAVESSRAESIAENSINKPSVVAVPPAAHAAAAMSAPTATPSSPPTPPRFDAAYLDNPAPAYPTLSRKAREEGRVVLKVLVEANGQPTRTEVQTSSGYERLDRAAQSAVSRWKFVPAKQGTDSVADWVLVPFVFSLKD